MDYEVRTISVFEKQTKRLFKKYNSLKEEILELVHTLKIDPFQGTDLGKGCYKIRISIASKRKGKSGGARIITHIRIEETVVYLLAIYDKSESDSISDQEIKDLLEHLD